MNRLIKRTEGVDHQILLVIAFFIISPVTFWLDGYLWPDKHLNGLYLLDILITGVAFWRFIWIQICISGLFTWCYYHFAPFAEPPLSAYIFQWMIYLLAMLAISTVIRYYFREKENILNLTLALAKSLDKRDAYTATHSENVAKYAKEIAAEMGFSRKNQVNLYIGGLLHDLGKIGVPESILRKQSGLTRPEYDLIKEHPQLGYDMVKHISKFRKNGILDMILYHHERYDGAGYPRGLKGEEIPLAARIMAVADSFDAITSNRIYREGMDQESAIQELCNNKGTQFDPEVVDRFVKILRRDMPAVRIGLYEFLNAVMIKNKALNECCLNLRSKDE